MNAAFEAELWIWDARRADTWTTSVFPDRGRGCYVLPVKKAVRKVERLDPGDGTGVKIEVDDR